MKCIHTQFDKKVKQLHYATYITNMENFQNFGQKLMCKSAFMRAMLSTTSYVDRDVNSIKDASESLSIILIYD